ALDSLEEQPYFLKIYTKIFDYITNPYFSIIPFLSSLPLKRNIEHSLLTKEFDKFLFKLIDQRRFDLSKAKNNKENTDLLAGLLEAAKHEKYDYTTKELRDEDIQKKAREEAINVLESASQIPTSENLKDLKYITAVIMESLRLYPPAVQLLFRIPTKPLNVSRNITIPKGIRTTASIWQVHRNPDLWKDADNIGQNLTMMEQKVIIAMLLLNFEVSLSPNIQNSDKLLLESSFLMRPKNVELVFSKLK
ncbi:16468_t:CDS:2, partial [Racocetra persica]